MTELAQIVHPNVALLTKHGKQDTIGPIILASFNSVIVHTDKFDTDTLGTFDRKTARTLSPIQCALKKAYLACELTGCEQGIGSEGSFNSILGMGLIDEEFIAFVDVKRHIEIIASARQAVKLGPIEANNKAELVQQLASFSAVEGANAGSDEQKWMLKQGQMWQKGLSADELIKQSHRWPIYVEPDFRAMHCQARQQVIASATHNLVHRLQTRCPMCKAVNFVEKLSAATTVYLPCELCGQATTKIAPPKATCDDCGFVAASDRQIGNASAFYCTYCNP